LKTLRKVRAFVGRHYVLKRLLLDSFGLIIVCSGEPGAIFMMRNVSNVMPKRIGIICSRRLILQGNLGYSVMSGRSVTDIITERIGPTLLLTLTYWSAHSG